MSWKVLQWKVLPFMAVMIAGGSWFGVALAQKVAVKQDKNVAVAEEGRKRAEQAAIVVPPTLVAPAPAKGPGTIALTGTLEPEATVEVTFKIPGRVSSVLFRRGDRVEAGKPMAVIETRDIGVQDAQAKAALKVAKAQQTAVADTLRRTKKLAEAGVGTEQQLALVSGQATVTSAAISQALAAAEAVTAMKAETTAVAPMSGDVVVAPTSSGFLINPGVPLFKIENLDTLRFVGQMSERNAVLIEKEATVTVTSEANRVAEGKVSLILGSIDPMSHRVPVEALIDNRERKLFAGALVDAQITIPAERLVSIPMSALLTGDAPAVLVVGQGEKLERRPLVVVETRDGLVLVRSGIALGDRIVDNPGTSWRVGDVLPATTKAPSAPVPATPAAPAPAVH
jgi:RND family efflux transporter MFP subunit